MFMDDIMVGLQAGGPRAFLRDAVLFGRDWGFRLGEIEVPVRWWQHAAGLIPKATFHLRPGDSHLSGYAASEEVIAAVAAFFEEAW